MKGGNELERRFEVWEDNAGFITLAVINNKKQCIVYTYRI